MVEQIPTYEQMMPVVLSVLADGQTKPLKQVYTDVSVSYGFPDAQLGLALPSGKQTYVRSRVGWAKTYLVKAGLIHQQKRGLCEITDKGREALASGQLINSSYLAQFDDFNDFRNNNHDNAPSSPGTNTGAVSHSD